MKFNTTWHTKPHINSNIILQSKHFMHDINYLAEQNFKKTTRNATDECYKTLQVFNENKLFYLQVNFC